MVAAEVAKPAVGVTVVEVVEMAAVVEEMEAAEAGGRAVCAGDDDDATTQ